MYVVPVKIDRSDIEGRGVFALSDITEGEIVWKFKNGHDKKISEQEYKKLDEKTKNTGYLSTSSGLYVFPPEGDPACFTNHSKNNNLNTVFDPKISEEPYFIANRDIKKGEELTNNYLEFDKVTQNLKPDWA
jgi:SET domain-containing protein